MKAALTIQFYTLGVSISVKTDFYWFKLIAVRSLTSSLPCDATEYSASVAVQYHVLQQVLYQVPVTVYLLYQLLYFTRTR